MPTKFNIDIIRGSRYLKSFVYQDSTRTPIDLTGLDARMQIRERESSPDPEIELTTTNGKLSIVGLDGKISIILTAIDTAGITINNGVYDLELYDSADLDVVDTILEGAVTINDGITR